VLAVDSRAHVVLLERDVRLADEAKVVPPVAMPTILILGAVGIIKSP
jgi:hypothetical protein